MSQSGYGPPPNYGTGGYGSPPNYGAGGYGSPPNYGTGGYGPPSNPYGPGPQAGGEPPPNQGNAIAALVANIVGLFLCCVSLAFLLAVPGLVLSIIGLVMRESNPRASRLCTLNAWICLGAAVVLSIVVVIFLFLMYGSFAATSLYY